MTDREPAPDRPLRIGDTVPLPPHKLLVRPSRNADDPARSPSGCFRNGQWKA